jgi:glyoxylase I family protein
MGNMRPATKLARLHHAAWVTRDQEKTRAFYEDVLGIPLTACWIEKNHATGREYCHTFFEIDDGGAIAFFDWIDEQDQPNPAPGPGHLALACDAHTQAALRERLTSAGYETRLTNHGYCVSLYVTDPNNYRLEFTVDTPAAVDEVAANKANAHEYLKSWTSGRREPNNKHRHENL